MFGVVVALLLIAVVFLPPAGTLAPARRAFTAVPPSVSATAPVLPKSSTTVTGQPTDSATVAPQVSTSPTAPALSPVPATPATGASAAGTTSDWAKWSALGTLLSAVVALVAVGVAIATQRRQVDESRRRQAARVLFYVHWEPDEAALVRVENRSDLPIFDVMSLPLKMVAEKLGEIKNVNFYQGKAIEANDNFEKRVRDVSNIFGHLSDDELWVEFTDAAGRRWQRSTSGLLVDKGRDASRWQSSRWQKGTAGRVTAAGTEAEAGTIDAAAQAGSRSPASEGDARAEGPGA